MRLDKWLWAARFFKARTLAADAVNGGKVQLNGVRTKAAREIHRGDRLAVSNGETHWEVRVVELSDKRGPAAEARLLYEETPDSIAGREARRENRRLQADPAADLHGRPSKHDRRRMDRFTGS